MWILVNGYSNEVEQHPNVGGLVQPRNWVRAAPWVHAQRPWAIDNDYRRFDALAFMRLLELLCVEHADPTGAGCLFVAVPDVYADWPATLRQWHAWRDRVWGYNMPLALVVQNGATIRNVPWISFRTRWRDCGYYSGAIFLGGTMDWKYSEDAAAIVRVANRLRLHTHWGRGNSRKAIAYARAIGCDSLDGGGFSLYRKHLAWGAPAAAAEYQPRLL